MNMQDGRDHNFDESRRLAALQRYGILDTPSDAIFDCITAAACSVCETPIALITLLDPDRQWFLSSVGVEISETPRDIAFCAHAITNPEVLTEVYDATVDNRFKDNPLVVGDPKICFYAGKPLVTPDGFPLGTLCVIGDKPKSLSDSQRSILSHLANLVMQLLEFRISSPVSVIGRAVEDKIPNGVVITDPRRPDHPITFCNKGFEELTGYTFLEITGKNCRFLQGQDTNKDKVAAIRLAIENRKPITTVLKNYKKDGTEFWNEITLSPITDGAGNLSHYLGFQYDVSSRVAAQEALVNSHQGLLKSIDLHSEISEALVKANAALLREISQRKHIEMQSMKLQDELVHIGRLSTMGEMATGLAHELNQPLLAISQSADTALMVALENKRCDPELVECINDIQAQTQRAGEIIRALRQFISRDTSNRCAVDINELAGQAVGLIKSDPRVLNILIQLEEANIPQPYVDRVQIAQVLVNLIRNSVDAICSVLTTEKSVVQHYVRVETMLKDSKIHVSVADSGPGFDPGIVAFKAFETTKEDGLGIGLSISRSIIESHEGELWMESCKDGGCRMLFTLPVNAGDDKTVLSSLKAIST